MKNVMLLAGAGQIGMAIARRVGTGMKIVIGDKKLEHAQNIETILNSAGFDLSRRARNTVLSQCWSTRRGSLPVRPPLRRF